MNKATKIQMEWIELGFEPLSYDDEGGWIDFEDLPENFDIGNLDAKHYQEEGVDFRTTLVRPKALRGLENNFGWKKIECKEDLPKPNQDVLIVCDYSKYGRGIEINHAKVHFTIESRPYGGPNALTGSGKLQGTYFSIPAILNPETVTHWMPLPQLPVNN